jgi:hypothetical protein
VCLTFICFAFAGVFASLRLLPVRIPPADSAGRQFLPPVSFASKTRQAGIESPSRTAMRAICLSVSFIFSLSFMVDDGKI